MGLKGTWALLVELGRVQEWIALHQEVHRASADKLNRGISAAYLSVFAREAGEIGAANKYAARARKLAGKNPPAIKVLARSSFSGAGAQ